MLGKSDKVVVPGRVYHTQSFPVEDVHFQQLNYSKIGQHQPEHSAPTFNKIQPLSVSPPNTDILHVKNR